MELLYLWIKKYKNIEKQGFNFSGKDEYKFTPNAGKEFTGGELTSTPKENYIPDFFAKNIDVTAIVGKNGAGKTSVLKVILYLIFRKDMELNDEKYKDEISFGVLKNIKSFLLFKEDDSYYIFHDNNFDNLSKIVSCDKSKKDIEIIPYTHAKIDFYSLYFNYMLDTLRDDENETWINKIFHKLDGYQTPLLLEPHKIDKVDGEEKEIIDISLLKYISIQRFLRTIVRSKNNDFIDDFFKPNKVILKRNEAKIARKVYIEIAPEDKREIEFVLDKLKVTNDLNMVNNIYIYYKVLRLKSLEGKTEHESLKNFNEGNINYYSPSPDEYDTIFDSISNYIDKNFNDIKSLLGGLVKYQKYKLEQAVAFKENILDENIEFNEDDLITGEDIKNNKILKNLPPWIDVEFYEDEKSFSSFSSGEKKANL